ncbi:agmatinase [Parafrankia irregularis]|uniref:Agmatinase n=1 Tax=Parafrankia irregularis TaxID=795642 RepID=A0A0S4QMC3_9ACTN|nr:MULTISPECIES: agmatinase [Parafrankia]MBE3201172.1 agmatinase [Parafrankia sp. CH37]CUU56393.1 agmatinase [Parafrankia irregularis]
MSPIQNSPREPVGLARYAGLGTFARLPRLDEVSRADVAVLGVPFDSGVSYRPGARFGPNHIRESSRLLRPYNPQLGVAPFQTLQVADAGDVAAGPYDLPAALTAIERHARDLLDGGARLLTIGGDHTISLPLLRAVAAVRGPVAVAHFDAHLDTWEGSYGSAFNHATPFRRAVEEGLIDMEASIHVGVRGPLPADTDLTDDARLGFTVITATEIELDGVRAAAERLRARIDGRPVYVSVDIDVLDPAHAPGTGTPEAGGLTSRELLVLLRELASVDVVSGDIVEVAPAYDHAQITGIAAAHTAYEIVSTMAVAPHPARSRPAHTVPTDAMAAPAPAATA